MYNHVEAMVKKVSVMDKLFNKVPCAQGCVTKSVHADLARTGLNSIAKFAWGARTWVYATCIRSTGCTCTLL